MSFEPVFENITLTEKIGAFTERIKVECKTNLSTESIKKIIFLSATPYLSNTECIDGGVKFMGKVHFFVCFEQEDGEVKKHECYSDFEGIIKTNSSMENCRAKVELKNDKTEANLSGITLSLICNIEAKATLKEKKDFPFVCGGEGMFCDSKEETRLRSLGEKSTVYPIEEEFELPYCVKEVLSQKAVATVSSCMCGVGTIIVDGEVNISQILLQSGEKRDIIKETRVIPFRAEIECDDAMPANLATAYLTEKSFRTDVTVDEEQNKSVVSCSVLLTLSGEAFALEEIQVVKDAFSLSNELELLREKTPLEKNKEQKIICERVVVKTEFEELPVGAVFCFITNEKAEIVSTKRVEDGLLITGTLSATAIFKDTENLLFARKMETPFETNIPINDCCYELNATIKKAEHKVLSLSTGELVAEICFDVVLTDCSELLLVKEIKCGLEKPVVDCALSVYIPMQGETLFPLAKRLNVNPTELILTNKELQFPLSGDERIVVYRQK